LGVGSAEDDRGMLKKIFGVSGEWWFIVGVKREGVCVVGDEEGSFKIRPCCLFLSFFLFFFRARQ